MGGEQADGLERLVGRQPSGTRSAEAENRRRAAKGDQPGEPSQSRSAPGHTRGLLGAGKEAIG